jgi:predicted AAA+ superfamily ATPase
VFADFLRLAAIGDTEVTNFSNIARESGVSLVTVRNHYQILEDTLLGSFVPAFVSRQKRRTVLSPKFYFHDVAVVNHCARRGRIQQGSELFGKAFENFMFHELAAHARYGKHSYDIAYWRLSSGAEVDFILGDGEVAVEIKGKKTVAEHDLKGLRSFAEEYPGVRKRIVVSLEAHARLTADGIRIVPYRDFLDELWSGTLL